MSEFVIGVLYIIIGFIMVYCLIDRICQAVEHSAMYKAYANYLSQGMNINIEELKKMAKK